MYRLILVSNLFNGQFMIIINPRQPLNRYAFGAPICYNLKILDCIVALFSKMFSIAFL